MEIKIYKEIIQEFNIKLNLIGLPTVSCLDTNEWFHFEYKYSLREYKHIGDTIHSGKFKIKINYKIVDINFITIGNKIKLDLDYTSLLEVNEILEYIKDIDHTIFKDIISPKYTLPFEDISLPLSVETYENLSTSKKMEIKKLISEMVKFKRDIRIDELLD